MAGATSFPGLLHYTLDPYLIMLSVKQGGIKYYCWVFGMTRPGIEPLSPGPLANTLSIYIYIYIYIDIYIRIAKIYSQRHLVSVSFLHQAKWFPLGWYPFIYWCVEHDGKGNLLPMAFWEGWSSFVFVVIYVAILILYFANLFILLNLVYHFLVF